MNEERAPQNKARLPGERTDADGKPVANQLLLSLPDDEFAAIRPELEFIDLPQALALHQPRHKLEFAYFPNSGMVSLVVTTRKRQSVEVGVVGNEGFTPMQVVAGLRRSPHLAIVQVAGSGSRIAIESLLQLLPATPDLEKSLNRYSAVHGLQVAQTAGCNRLHDLEQRLARWLLLTQDRVDSALLRITHEFLATMLGTDRPSVSLAAGTLQRKRIIEYTHGAVKILNRKRLESSACECYSVIQQFSGEVALR